jgi:hypothetical protein
MENKTMATKIDKNIIKLPEGRLSYAYLATPKPKPPKNGKEVAPRYETVVLLDPTNATQKAAIDALKAEAVRIAQEAFGANVEMKKLVLAFGNGDKKAIDEDGAVNPTYEAYKGMVYVNTSTSDKPLIANRGGHLIEKTDAQFPYSGCYANVRVTLYPWTFTENNMTRRGISVDLRSIQFVRDGTAFGGRQTINPEEEFEALGDAPGTTSSVVDPFDLD